eukprot:2379422-Amphidinium_carterae.1
METASSSVGPRHIIDLDLDSSPDKKAKVDDVDDTEKKEKSESSITTTVFNRELEDVVERELADMLGPTPDEGNHERTYPYFVGKYCSLCQGRFVALRLVGFEDRAEKACYQNVWALVFTNIRHLAKLSHFPKYTQFVAGEAQLTRWQELQSTASLILDQPCTKSTTYPEMGRICKFG